MAQNNSVIINHWSLLAFAREFGGDFAVGQCNNELTGEAFPACTFTKNGKRTFVNFGKSLEGGLTIREVLAQKEELQVVQLDVEPDVLERRKAKGAQLETYKLCKKGESSWDSVDLLA